MRVIVQKRGFRLLPLLALAVAVGLVVLISRNSYGASDLGPFEIDGFPASPPAGAELWSYYSGNDAPPANDWADGDGLGGTDGVFKLNTGGTPFASCYGSNIDLDDGYSPDTTRFICDGFTGLDLGKPENNIVSPAGDIPDDIWPITTANNLTPKDDLSHGYFLLDKQPCSTDNKDHTIIVVGMERGNNEGANHWGIELNQVPPTGLSTISQNLSPAANFGLDFNRTNGDVFVSVELEKGGTVPTITVTQVFGTPAQGADATFKLATALATCGDYANNRTSTNLVEQVAPPWNIFSCDPTAFDGGTNSCRVANQAGTGLAAGACGTNQNPKNCTRLAPRDFVEVAIDITAYGLTAECFADVLLTTRSAPPGGVDPATGIVDLSGADVKDVTGDFLDVCGMTVDKTGDTLSKVGDPADYTITVTNTGSVDLYKDDITDTVFGNLVLNGVNQANPNAYTSFNFATATPCGAVLAAGASCTIQVTRTVQAGDPDPLPNTVTVVYNSNATFTGTALTQTDNHSVNLFQPSVTIDKTGDTLSKVGDAVDYTITVNNTSSADTPDLTCTISDSLLTVPNATVTLASGASAVRNISRTVVAGDPDPLVNTASVSCSPAGFSNVLTASDGHSVNLFQPSITLDKTGDTLSKVGDSVDYTITLNNTSSADTPALTCTISDSLLTVPNATVTLASGASAVRNISRTVVAGDPDPLVNTASVSCSPAGFPNVLTASNDHTVNLFQPSITLDKTGDTLSKVGDAVDYTITLNNTSSADTPDLTCTITDSLLTVPNGTVTLASGANAVRNISRTVVAGDPDPLVNTASVTCTVGGGFGNTLTASEGHSVNLFQPSVTIDKTGNTLSKVGDPVNYTITVTNTSSADTPDMTCTISDSLLTVPNATVTLASGANAVRNITRNVQAGDPDPLVNTASVSCSPAGFPNVLTASDGHSVDLFGPTITLVKTGDTLSKVGDAVDYTITLTNTSSADTPDLTCTITDSLLPVPNPTVTLASGASAVRSISRTVVASDPDPLVNTASVTCTVNGFPNVLTASEGHSVNLFQPSVTIDKTGDALSKVGDAVDYTITVNNTSSADTPDMTCTISDSLLTVPNATVTLASGANAVRNISRTVVASDPDPLVNTASVSCSPAGFPNVLTASEGHSVNLFQPSVTIDKTGDTLSKVGDAVDYTITVNNTSSADTPDMTCTISDSLLTVPNATVTLASGANAVRNITRTVVAGDPDPLVNTASVSCSPAGFPNVLTASNGHTVNLFQPSVTINKTGDALSKVGDAVDYTITVTNTSSADTPDLTCTISDSLLTVPNATVTLASGANAVRNITRTVVAGDPDPLVNTASVSCSPAGFPNVLTASEGHSVNLFQPSVTIDKTGDALSKVGDAVDYTITVNNTSSADTPNLTCTISDSLLTVPNATVTLASGANAVRNISRTVVAGDPDPLVNTASVSCSPAGFPNVLTASEGHTVNLFQPSVTIVKTGDALSKVGDPVNYTITVTNTSSADTPNLTCTITDSLLTVPNGNVNLASGGSAVRNITRTVVAGDPDPLVNTASVACTVDGFGNALNASEGHSVNLFQPGVDVEKVCDDFAKFPAAGDALNASDDIRCTITVTNTGSADSPDLENGTIVDTLCGNLLGVLNATCAPVSSTCTATLATGASCQVVYDFLAASVQATPDPLSNTVTVHYNPIGFPNDITDADTETIDVLHPNYTVLKDCLTDVVPPGGSAIFGVDIANTGDTVLTVTADEDMTDVSLVNNIGVVTAGTSFTLGVGVTKNFEITLIAGAGPIITNVVNTSATLPVSTGLTNVLNRTATDFCTVQGGATRTPGFWQTHLDYTCHIFEDHLGGSIDLGWKTLTSCEQVFGMFWANNARESDGTRRTKICQAQVIGSFQLLAAILNTGLDNGAVVPIDSKTGLDIITAMQNALAAGDFQEIKRLGSLLDAYNNSGDDIAIIDNDGTPAGRANPKGAKAAADYTIADCP